MTKHTRDELELIGMVPELLLEDIKLLVEKSGPLRQCTSMESVMLEKED